MNIIIVDGHTLNPGDLSWADIEEFGNLTIFERTSANMTLDRCREASVILTNKVPITKDTILAAKDLRLICVTATGFNIVDVDAARENNVTVCNVPDYGAASVAQHTFALLLELTNRVGLNSQSVRAGDWERSEDFCYTKANLTELQGKTFGIVGLGKIGEHVARIADAFGMNVIFNSATRRKSAVATYVEMDTLFATSDVISLHCPLTKDNAEFVNRRLLDSVKASAFLINTARGQLIDEADLATALNNNQLRGAALDVLSTEPPKASNPLLRAPNCIVTPHNAWMSLEARTRMMEITLKNIEAFLSGKPVNVVSG